MYVAVGGLGVAVNDGPTVGVFVRVGVNVRVAVAVRVIVGVLVRVVVVVRVGGMPAIEKRPEIFHTVPTNI